MKFYHYMAAAAFAVVSLTSCSDFLDEDNKSAANNNGDAYLQANPEAFRPVAFDAFKSIVTNISLQDQGADLYINPRGADDGTYSKYNFTVADGGVASWYGNLSKAINYANGMVYYNGADSKLGAEGRFLRNWGLYLMIQHFGDVPYLTDYVMTSTRDYPRVPIAELYPAIIEDLTDVYNNSQLPANSAHDGTVSKQAVAALLAKVCLAAGWDLETSLNNEAEGTYTVKGTGYFTQAAAWAEKAINGLKLTMSFEDKWSPKNQANAEEIFSIMWNRSGYPGDVSTGGNSLMYDYMGYYGNSLAIGLKPTGSGGTNVHSEKSLTMWERGDQRFDATFMTTMYNSAFDKDGNLIWGTTGYLAYFNASAAELEKMPIACKFFPSYTTQAEAKAWMDAHKSQIKKLGKEEAGYISPFVAIMGANNASVLTWDINATGGYGSVKTTAMLEYMRQTSGNGMCVKKFDDPETANVTSNNCYRNVPAFHVSDMYLVAAEAYLLANQEAQSLQKINDVRTRAGLKTLSSFDAYEAPYTVTSNFKETKLDLILDERARELYAERTRWEDLRRTRQLVRYNVQFARSISSPAEMQNSKGETKWYRPIPEEEINRNTSMTAESQNPGY